MDEGADDEDIVVDDALGAEVGKEESPVATAPMMELAISIIDKQDFMIFNSVGLRSISICLNCFIIKYYLTL